MVPTVSRAVCGTVEHGVVDHHAPELDVINVEWVPVLNNRVDLGFVVVLPGLEGLEDVVERGELCLESFAIWEAWAAFRPTLPCCEKAVVFGESYVRGSGFEPLRRHSAHYSRSLGRARRSDTPAADLRIFATLGSGALAPPQELFQLLDHVASAGDIAFVFSRRVVPLLKFFHVGADILLA